MIRYFICENCHRGYEADDAGNTNCPYCHSDNVRPARKPSSALKYIGMVAVFAGCCLIGFLLPIGGQKIYDKAKKSITTIVREAPVSQKTDEVVSTSQSSQSLQTTQPIQLEDATRVPVINKISNPTSGDKVKIYLMAEFGSEPLYTSVDGNFKNVASIAGGVYKVVAENIKTGDRSVEKYVSGCVPVQKIEKLTTSQMQSAFNTGSIPTKDFMAKFVASPKINVVGMEEGEPQVANVGEVFNRIGSGLWLSVEVSDVNYASDNRVSSFTVKVTY